MRRNWQQKKKKKKAGERDRDTQGQATVGVQVTESLFATGQRVNHIYQSSGGIEKKRLVVWVDGQIWVFGFWSVGANNILRKDQEYWLTNKKKQILG